MKTIDAGSLHRCEGFTLLELLVALAIFGLVAVMAYGGLGTVLEQRAYTDASAQRLGALQKTYLVMQRDIEQAVARAIRDEYGDEQPPLASAPVFQLTRGGWSNPAGRPRSSLQRVGYDLEEQQLVRYAWPVLDRAQDSQPLQQALADHIVSIQARYLDAGSNWHESWPPLEPDAGEEAVEPGLPAAVEVSLEHEYFGNLTWLFQLPR
jgi:general secretion pathway protein J